MAQVKKQAAPSKNTGKTAAKPAAAKPASGKK